MILLLSKSQCTCPRGHNNCLKVEIAQPVKYFKCEIPNIKILALLIVFKQE